MLGEIFADGNLIPWDAEEYDGNLKCRKINIRKIPIISPFWGDAKW